MYSQTIHAIRDVKFGRMRISHERHIWPRSNQMHTSDTTSVISDTNSAVRAMGLSFSILNR
jgi:hypothetical protein